MAKKNDKNIKIPQVNIFNNPLTEKEEKSNVEKSVVSTKNKSRTASTKKSTATKKKSTNNINLFENEFLNRIEERRRVTKRTRERINEVFGESNSRSEPIVRKKPEPMVFETKEEADKYVVNLMKNEAENTLLNTMRQGAPETLQSAMARHYVNNVLPTNQDEENPYSSMSYKELETALNVIDYDWQEGSITAEEAEKRKRKVYPFMVASASAEQLEGFRKKIEDRMLSHREVANEAFNITFNFGTEEQQAIAQPIEKKAMDDAYYYENLLDMIDMQKTNNKYAEELETVIYSYGEKALDAADKGVTSKYTPTKTGKEDYDKINRGNNDDVYGFLETTELGIYNTLYNSGDYKGAAEFIEEIMPNLKKRLSEYETAQAYEFGKKHPYLAGAASVGKNVFGGAVAAIDNLGDKIFLGEVDTYDATARNIRESQAYRQGGTAYMTDKHNAGAAFAYNVGASMAEFGLNLLVGKGAGVVAKGLGATTAAVAKTTSNVMSANMASNAAANSMISIADRGGSDMQIITGGLASAFAEYAFEKYSIDKFFDMKTAGVVADSFRKTVKNAVKNMPRMAIQGGVEASEEFFTSVANLVSDAIIMQNKSENAIKRRKYILEDGLSAEEASKRVFIESVEQLALDAAAGFASGTVIGGINLAVQDVSHTRYMANAGERMIKNPDILNTIVGIGVQNGNSEAITFTEKIKNGESVSGKQAGRVLESVISESITKDGGIKNIMNTIKMLEGNNSRFRNSQEAFDTAKAVMHMAQGKATEVDNALLSRSSGAVTLLTAVEGNSKALKSIKTAAQTQLRESAQGMRNAEYGVRSASQVQSGEILRGAQNDNGYGVRSEKAFEGIKYRVGYTDKNNPVVMLEED
ncbi:MAG: hypothetical protein IJD91_01320, partial [Clostridia bacterium]|nr:hypothetical protein [Clostridia bacterium]